MSESRLKYLEHESSVLSSPAYAICEQDPDMEDVKLHIQRCSAERVRLLVWKTQSAYAKHFEQLVGSEDIFTEEILKYTININGSLLACIGSRQKYLNYTVENTEELPSDFDFQKFCNSCVGYAEFCCDPNLTDEQAGKLLYLKLCSVSEDTSQHFMCLKREQETIGFMKFETVGSAATCKLFIMVNLHRAEENSIFMGLALESLYSHGILKCIFEISKTNVVPDNLVKSCGGVFHSAYVNFKWWLPGTPKNDVEISEIPYHLPYLTGKEIVNLAAVCDQSSISTHKKFGPYCEKFLEKSTGCLKALLVSSGTSALEMCSLILNLGPGDEVIMPSYTFVSTANAFVIQGVVPVFVDIRADTLNIDENIIESAVTEKTRAIVVVHYAGISCEMDAILNVAEKHKLYVIEDNAHGIYAKYKGKCLGTFGHLSASSFHYTKNISCGEGGAVFVNDYRLVSRSTVVWEKGTNRHDFMLGKVDKYSWIDKGSSFVLSEVNAALLAAQVSREYICRYKYLFLNLV